MKRLRLVALLLAGLASIWYGESISSAAGGSAASYRPVVEAAYQEWLGRLPNQQELDYWTGALARGQRTEAAMRQNHQNHLKQYERDAAIVRSYQEVFGRAPNEGELNHWRGQVQAGVSYKQMVQLHRGWVAKNPVPTAQPQVQAPKNIENVGNLSLRLSPSEIQKMISLTTADPLTAVEPLANVTPFTMPIGNNFTMPIGNNFQTQSTVDPRQMVAEAFQMAFGRNPSAEELRTWVEFNQKYLKSTVATSARNLAETLRYVLILPAGEIQRKGMVQTAVPLVFHRAPTPNELGIWSERIRRERMLFTDLVSAMRREAGSQSSPPQGNRGGGGRRGQPVPVGG